MVTGRLEAVLARDVGDGAALAGRVDVAVRAAPVAVRVRLLLEVGAVLLRVGGAELAVPGQVPLLAQDRGRLRVAVVATAVVLGRRRHQQR
uniref:Uncharacterized protein n=1 Tax=Anopheles dirus TaxID=7168 RepID=A0A182NW62_9DIPT